jgi:Tfp pilus assembly protein PilF
MGQEQTACDLFEQAVKDGAPGTGALVNLGTCQAKRSDIGQAMKLWSEALQRNPAVEAARMNLAIAESQSGDPRNAEIHLRMALQYDPFSSRVRELLQSIGNK